MRNLIGYLKRILLLFSLVSFFFILNASLVKAADTFTVTTDFTHTINDTNISTDALITISTNNTRVISYYTATLPTENLKVKCYIANTNKEYSCTNHSRTGATDILVDLNNAVVQSTKPLQIRLAYNTTVSQTNSYNISSFVQDTSTNSITVIYPKIQGEPLWTSDSAQSIRSIGENYQLIISKPIYHNLSILFGKEISYQFTVSKTFTNSQTDSNQTFELILPADTANQTIVWDEVSPLPNISQKDEDGNYVFQYTLAPQATTDCIIKGHIVKHTVQEDKSTIATFLTQNTGYWSTTSKTEFTRIDNYLKDKGLKLPEGFSNIHDVDESTQELVYKYLYSYVVDRLNPQKTLSEGVITDSRVGFDNIVSNPNGVTPSDYTDFLITIFRKYKIPARQVIGYVSNISGYTSDGFYNYWTEVYDYTQNKWLTLDPFLEDYSSRSLFRDNFYDHISILVRGKSSVAPKLTFYNDSDFVVTSSSTEDIVPTFSVDAQLVFDNNNILSKYIKVLVNVSNTGNVAIRNSELLKSSFEDITKYLDPVNNLNSQIILPKQNATIQYNLLNTNSYSNSYISMNFSNMQLSKEVLLQSDLKIIIPMYINILTKIISMGTFIGLIYLVYFFVKKFKNKKNG